MLPIASFSVFGRALGFKVACRQTPYDRSSATNGPARAPVATRPTIVQQRSTVGVYGHVLPPVSRPHGFEAVRVGWIGRRMERGISADARTDEARESYSSDVVIGKENGPGSASKRDPPG